VPEVIRIVPRLPRSRNGSIIRAELRLWLDAGAKAISVRPRAVVPRKATGWGGIAGVRDRAVEDPM